MKIQHIKDAILFKMSAAEMRQVMEEKSMIHLVWRQFDDDVERASRDERWVPQKGPLKIFHEEEGRGHVLQCRVHLWPYFRELEAANPLEREIRSEMLSVGLSGEADRRAARYAS